MPGKFLIDITDPRLQTAENAHVIEFIRHTNPFAHSDLGSVLFALATEIPGAHAYCPSPNNCAYVVLHDTSLRIFAIAYGQKALGLRLPPSSIQEAVSDGATHSPDIGPDWVTFNPWDVNDKARLQKIRAWARTASESRSAP